MTEILLENGTCLGFGATNAREGQLANGDLLTFEVESTPSQPDEFARWIGRKVLDASDRGDKWVVAGFPGPVREDGRFVGPMVNVNGFKNDGIDLVDAMSESDPAVGRLLDNGFTLLNVNDGELAAQAVAGRIAEAHHKKVAALIIGTGVGAGLAIRDEKYTNVFRGDNTNPNELGHPFFTDDPTETFENTISGPALNRRYDKDPSDIPAGHSAWLRVGSKAAQLIMLLGLIQGAELVVPTGGVGAGASEKYASHLYSLLDRVRTKGNKTQQKFIPEVGLIPSSDSQTFEMFGALGVMRDHLTKNAVAA